MCILGAMPRGSQHIQAETRGDTLTLTLAYCISWRITGPAGVLGEFGRL